MIFQNKYVIAGSESPERIVTLSLSKGACVGLPLANGFDRLSMTPF